MDRNVNVLSLFDGMSCGQIALRELGIPIGRYYASEIDSHAIAQTQLNFPETIQLGDVTQWHTWQIDWSGIDLILAGSPCQGFSVAGKMMAFDDPRSSLFWVFVDILRHTQRANPKVRYLLENVRMKAEHEATINEALGLEPVVINSALVSAQNRVRLYWTDIKTETTGLFGAQVTAIPQPKDRGIFIRDILEEEVERKYYLSNQTEISQGSKEHIAKNLKGIEDKSHTLLATSYKGSATNGMTLIQEADPICVAMRGRGANNEQTLEAQPSGKSNCLTSVTKDNLVIAGTWRTHREDRGFRPLMGDKAGCITARAREDGSGQGAVQIGYHIRRLTPTECARLQTIPEWYKWQCSDTQAYKMLGNGWTVEAIKHILSYLQRE